MATCSHTHNGDGYWPDGVTCTAMAMRGYDKCYPHNDQIEKFTCTHCHVAAPHAGYVCAKCKPKPVPGLRLKLKLEKGYAVRRYP